MKLQNVQSVIALGLALQLGLGVAVAASPAIGTAVTKGPFRVDNATVNGNATLFEGATIETAQAASTVELNSGARVYLAASSKGKLYGDHLVLEKGEGRLDHAAGFRMEANGLTIQPETGTSSGRVTMSGANRVQVAALSGSFRVLNARGVLVANVANGKALEFEPQQASGMSRLTGTARSRNGRLLITDETTSVTAEITGAGLAKEIGKRIEVTGTLDPTATPLSEASQAVRVTRYVLLAQNEGQSKGSNSTDSKSADSKSKDDSKSKGGGKAAAAGVGGVAGTAAGTAAGGILGASVTTIAIVGGVAAAGTLGGLAAADKLPGQGNNPPSVSR